MSTKDRFKMFGICDICHKEVLAQNCFRLGYDLLYCPECYKNIVHEGRLDGRDSGASVDSGSPIKGRPSFTLSLAR